MKARFCHLLAAAALLGTEIYIGIYVRDAFIRPYGGDILVAILLCCLWRCIFPKGSKWMVMGIFLLCAAVEFSQLLNLPSLLGLQGTVIGIILGNSFSWLDIVCYGAGCILFFLLEHVFSDKNTHPSL